MALAVVWGVIDLTKVIFDAAGNSDQEQPGRPVPGPEPVRAAAGQEHEAARRGIEGVAAAPNGQFAVEHVETLIFPVMNMQRRSGLDRGLKDAQGSARGVLRRLQARIVRQPRARRDDIASQEIGHGYMMTPRLVYALAVKVSYLLGNRNVMAQREKRSVSQPPDLARAIEQAAKAEGTPFHAWPPGT